MSTYSRRLGKYELQERLGQGGMAEVWKALDPQLKRYVAIKFLHTDLRSAPDFVARFIREGQAIAALRHPNIVQVYDFQTSSAEDGTSLAYMVMDYIEGSTLAHYIRHISHAHQTPSPDEIVRLFTSISLAIDYAHEHGMIHRDIKPANILLDTRNTRRNPMGEPILTDFGIAKMVGAETLTAAGMSMGTPLYISPEQARGQPGNEKSDIYSLAVVLYEVCTGVPPFKGDSAYAILLQHLQDPPPPPSRVNPVLPPALDGVIARGMAKDPAARFPSAAAMTAALAQALNVPVPKSILQSLPSLDSITSSSDNMETVLASENPGGSAPTQGASRLETVLASENPHGSAPTQGETRQSTVPAASPPVPAAMRDTPRPSIPVSQQPFSEAPTAPPVAPVPQPAPGRQRNRLLTIIIPIALLVLIGAGLGTFLFTRHSSSPTGTGGAGGGSSANIVGQATFVSSGQLTAQDTPAINDGMQVRLEHVANPSSGNRYYAWLQNSNTETVSVLLGTLTVNNGVATLSYSDPQHRDLLGMMSNFLVTEESASVTPNNPSLDKGQWRYVGSIPQVRSSKDNFSYLDHIRHLLSNEPGLQKLQLQGGVDYWFLNNIQQMQKSAIEVRDHVNVQFVRQQVTNILYYLDGKCAPQDLQNAPVQTSPENAAIAHATSIGLLDCSLAPEPPGHVTHIGLHLNGIAQSPGATASEIQRAIEINKDLNTVKAWLEKVRADALQLAVMDDAHLSQAQSLRNDLLFNANNVLNGSVDPSTGAVIPSIQQLTNTIELLASIDVMPYKAA